MCLAQQNCLAQSRDIDNVPCGAIVLGIEKVAAIEDVSRTQVIAAPEGDVFFVYKIETVKRR